MIFKGKHGPLLIAEIGGNHEGDFEYAKKLTELAIEADVDFIKFQLYTGDGLVNPLENLQRNQHFKKIKSFIRLTLNGIDLKFGFLYGKYRPTEEIGSFNIIKKLFILKWVKNYLIE